MENAIYDKWAEILRTIGHPIRIRIIESLLEDDKCVSNIWGSLGLSQATVSQHLSLLRTRGIVRNCRYGTKVKYSVIDRRIEEIINLIKKGEFT